MRMLVCLALVATCSAGCANETPEPATQWRSDPLWPGYAFLGT